MSPQMLILHQSSQRNVIFWQKNKIVSSIMCKLNFLPSKELTNKPSVRQFPGRYVTDGEYVTAPDHFRIPNFDATQIRVARNTTTMPASATRRAEVLGLNLSSLIRRVTQ